MSLIYNQLAEDLFQRPDENPLDNGVWTTVNAVGPLQVLSDQCADVANDAGASQYTGISWPANQWAEVTIGEFDISGGSFSEIDIIIRGDAALDNDYALALTASNGIVVNQNSTVLHTIPGQPQPGQTWRFGFYGSTWEVYLNGVLQATGTDATIASGSAFVYIADNNGPSDTTITAWRGGSITQSGGGGSQNFSPNIFGTNDYGPGINSPKTSVMGTNGRTRIVG